MSSTKLDDAELELARAEAELATFEPVRQMFLARLAEGLITEAEYSVWVGRHISAQGYAVARRDRAARFMEGLLAQEERRLLHDAARDSQPTEIKRLRKANATLLQQIESQSRRLREQSEQISRLQVAAPGKAVREKYLRQLARRGHEITYVLRETQADGHELHPLLAAYVAQITIEGEHHLPYGQFLAEDAEGFRAHLERVMETTRAAEEVLRG